MSRSAPLFLATALFAALSLAPAHAEDAPEISRSLGEPGGVVVFWPRIIPRTDNPAIRQAATTLQQHLVQVTTAALPSRTIDTRPEPERVCPRQGCRAMTVGALLVHSDGEACAVVGLVSGPDKAPATLVPWGGAVDLKQPTVPFRDYPESAIVIRDFARCSTLAESMVGRDAAMTQALQTASTLRE